MSGTGKLEAWQEGIGQGMENHEVTKFENDKVRLTQEVTISSFEPCESCERLYQTQRVILLKCKAGFSIWV